VETTRERRMHMFNMNKLDETIEYIEDSIMDEWTSRELYPALGSLVRAGAVAESHVCYNKDVVIDPKDISQILQ